MVKLVGITFSPFRGELLPQIFEQFLRWYLTSEKKGAQNNAYNKRQQWLKYQ